MSDQLDEIQSKLTEARAAIGMDQVVNRAILAVLLARELRRGEDERTLYEEIHRTVDDYYATGKTSQSLMEVDRQRARDVTDLIFSAARLRLGRK